MLFHPYVYTLAEAEQHLTKRKIIRLLSDVGGSAIWLVGRVRVASTLESSFCSDFQRRKTRKQKKFMSWDRVCEETVDQLRHSSGPVHTVCTHSPTYVRTRCVPLLDLSATSI